MTFFQKIHIFLLFVLSLGLTFPAMAQNIVLDLSKIKPLTHLQMLTQEEFENQTKLIDDTPYDDSFLSFQLRLPKAWEESTAKLNATKMDKTGVGKEVLGIVKRYVSPPQDHLRSFMTIEALELTHEIGARDWFIQYVLKSALSIEQVGLEKDGQVEALYVEVEGDQTYIVRVKVILNGSRIIVVRYYVPMELYHKEKVQQAQVIDSFELTNRKDENVEELKVYGFLDQSFINYPVSWIKNSEKIRSMDRMQAMFFRQKENGQLAGQINVYLSSANLGTTRAEELNLYKDKFKIEGYEFGQLIERPQIKYNKNMTFGVTEVYRLESQSVSLIDYELWVSVLENKKYIYIVTLLTPIRNEDFYAWARNKATYELMLSNLRAEDETLDLYQFIR